MSTDLQDGREMTPAPRDEQAKLEQWANENRIDPNLYVVFTTWHGRAALAESELAEVKQEVESLYELHQEGLEAHAQVSKERDELRAELERVKESDDLALYSEIQNAASTLPDGWEIRLCVEKDSGYVELYDEDGCRVDFPSSCEHLRYTVADAVEFAIGAGEGEAR